MYVSGENPNSSKSTYSMLLVKLSSPKSCVSTWKKSYANRSPSSPTMTTSVAEPSSQWRPSPTQKTCVERWDMPCGRPTSTNVMQTIPLERQQLILKIYEIKRTAQNITDSQVSRSLYMLSLYKSSVYAI